MWTISFSYRELILSVWYGHRGVLLSFYVICFLILALWNKGISSSFGFSLYIQIPSPQLQTPGKGSHSVEHAQLCASGNTFQRRHLKLSQTSLAEELWLQGEEQTLSGWNRSHLWWSGVFVTWLLYHCATLFIYAIVISPALSITGALEKEHTERVNWYKPKFLAEQRQHSSTAAVASPLWSSTDRSMGAWEHQRLSQFACWYEERQI